MTNALVKRCACWRCGETMEAGEPFQFVKGHRWAVGHFAGGTNTTAKVDAWKPAHTDEHCAVKSLRAKLLAAHDNATQGGLQLMRDLGHWTADNEAAYLAKQDAKRAEIVAHYA